jgi:outer membrane usher protein
MALLTSAVASAAERKLALELVLNGRPTGRVAEIIDRDGTLYAKPSELSELGFVLPPAMTAGTEPIPLASLADMHARLNEARQTLVVEAGDAALQPNELAGGPSAEHLAPLSPAGYGALLNYDLLGTHGNQQITGGALLDLRGFGPYGVLEGTGLTNLAPVGGQAATIRLDTFYSYADPDDLRRWRAGDLVSGALSWTRAVRLGGVQVSSDFTLRPDLVTYPLPVLSASTAVPSTVDVIINGSRAFSESVPPGPFAVRTLPMVTGAGEMAVTVMDALGRQTVVTLPFYASATLLKPGLASYSLEAGTVRQNYGLNTDRYSGAAASGSLRFGLTDWLTLEGHMEATNTLGVLGGGVAMRLGSFGVVDLALAGSDGRAGANPAVHGSSKASNSGAQVSAGFQRTSHNLNFNVNGSVTMGGYGDIAVVNGAPVATATLNASLGYQLGRFGTAGVGYISRVVQSGSSGPLGTQFDPGLLTNQSATLATASYSIPVGGRASFYASAFKDVRNNHNFGVMIGLTFSLGTTTSISAGSALNSGRFAPSLYAAKPALEENDFGYRLQDVEGIAADRSAEGDYMSPWGQVTVGIDQSPGQHAERAGVRGALGWVGGHLFASNQITDSFAVVTTGGVAGVPVLYENRPVGTTDSGGYLLVPSLLSYQNNRLEVDPTKLPADIDVGQTSMLVRPPDRSGVVIDFLIRQEHAALLRLVDGNGKPLALGSVAKVAGVQDRPVGYDGEAYVTGLLPNNHLVVRLPDGTSCHVHFDYKPVPGDIPAIGPLRCQ